MRVMVTLDADVAAAIDKMRREHGMGPSEAINTLVRRVLEIRSEPLAYEHRSFDMGARVDPDDIGTVLDLLDDEPV